MLRLKKRTIDVFVTWGGPLSSAVWLFFLVSPIQSELSVPHSIGFTVLLFGEVATFVAVYLILVLRDTYSGASSRPLHLRRDLMLLVIMTVLSICTTLMAGPSWIAGLLYTSAAAGSKLPTKWSLSAIAILEGLTVVLTPISGGTWVDAGQSVVFVGVIGLMTSGVCRMIITIRALEKARQEVARLAVSEERLRMARDLHDLLGHSLSLIAVKSELAKRLVRLDPDETEKEIADIERVSRQALADVRSAVSGYRQLSLVQELAASEEILSAANIRADMNVSLLEIHPKVESVLAWSIREGTTNVVRHSRARRCIITIVKSSNAVQCDIRNDDKGSGATLPDRDTPSLGNGLTGLAERVRAVQGEMKATVLTGDGFLLSVTVPIEHQQFSRE